MRISLAKKPGYAQFVDPGFDPLVDFQPTGTPGSDMLETILLDPSLDLSNWSLDPETFRKISTYNQVTNVLRQQQYLVYEVANQLGVLSPFLGPAKQALQLFDVTIHSGDQHEIINQAVQTSIGAATVALSAVPSIWTKIASALISVVGRIVDIFASHGPGKLRDELLPAQKYLDRVDSDLFNANVRAVMRSGYNWNSIFMPAFKGELSAQARDDARVIAWALGDGNVPTPIIDRDSKGDWSFGFDSEGSFISGGGLGMIPGGERIYSVVQSTIFTKRVGPDSGHPTLYGPRDCSPAATETIDVGTYYPSTSQGAMTLWSFIFQRGAALYTLDAGKILDAWEAYFDSIWDGVHRLWRDTDWMGEGGNHGLPGWGAEVWENTLMDLVRNYTVGLNNQIGVLSWAPTCGRPLTDKDTETWSKNNTFKEIIQPALFKLREAQLWYLRNTTIAAYLPIYGGREADPLQQEAVMGSMHDLLIAKEVVDARKRIYNGDAKHDVRLDDVLDPQFKQQIKAAGGGTNKIVFGFTAGPPANYVAVPQGGTGIKPPRWPYRPRRPNLKAAIVFGAIMAAGGVYYYRSDRFRQERQR